MADRDSPTDGIERRGVLAALATGLGGVGVARSSLAREITALDPPRYVVEQGSRCVPVTPLSGDEPVEAFYDYRTPYTAPSGSAYSSYGTTDLQRPETSICLLYDGPAGLSLVIVHDKLNDGTDGGAVTFDLRFENPDRGAWVVGDDDYDAPSNYDTFDRTAEGWTVDWTWADGRSDGGVYHPLGDDFAVTIDPAFNDAATLYGNPYEGTIADWQFLSGDRSAPARIPLALDRPLTIRAGTCGGTTTTRTQTTRETTNEQTTEREQSADPISADVEVVPGAVNPRSHGRLPVVVHSDAAFDATTLAPGSVTFGPGNASPVHRIRTDHDGDGRSDLKLHFRMDATGIDWTTDQVRLTGKTANGRTVVGVTDLELVPSGGADEDGEPDESEGKQERSEEREEKQEQNQEKREEKQEKREEKHEEDEDEEDEEDEEDDDEADEEGEDDDDEAKEDEDGEADEEGEDDDDEAKEDEDDEEDDHPGNGNGNGRGRGNGNGRGGGNDRGNGRGRGNGNGRERGRDESDGEDDDEDDEA